MPVIPSLCPCSDSSMDGEPSWSPVRDHTTLPGRAWRNDVKKIERVVFDLKRSDLVRAAFNLFLCPVYPAEYMRSLRPLSLGSYRHFFLRILRPRFFLSLFLFFPSIYLNWLAFPVLESVRATTSFRRRDSGNKPGQWNNLDAI